MKRILSIVNLLLLILSSLFPIFSNPYQIKTVDASSNVCGGGSQALTTPKVGGVALNQAATFLAEMTEYTGAYYDDENDRIVFIGRTNTSAPQFDKDDLAIAIRTLFFENKIPAVSLDDDPNPNFMAVRFTGNLEDTSFGQTLLDADWKLKQYMHGYDENTATISSTVTHINQFCKDTLI